MPKLLEPHRALIHAHPLFDGIAPADMPHLLECAAPRLETYSKGDILIHEMSETDGPGIMLSGQAEASRLDREGRRLLVRILGRGSLFGEVLALGDGQRSPVTVTVTESSEVLHLHLDWIIGRCERACASHSRVLRNILTIVSGAYFELHERLGCLIRPTLREKILYYLQSAAALSGGHTFRIPFDRAGLADYLAADRSALSRELSRMKQDGLIDYYKDSFRLL